MTAFVIGQTYARARIREIVGDPASRGGAWDTGYRQWRGEFFVFAGVETSGRTGHDYANHWVGEALAWEARSQTKISDPEIQRLVSGQAPVHLFTRSDNSAAFT